MTLEASRLMVLATTAPQPSSKALPMTLALVPGGPEPMTKGLGSFRPLTVVARVGIGTPKVDSFGSRQGRQDAEVTKMKTHGLPFLARLASWRAWPIDPIDHSSI